MWLGGGAFDDGPVGFADGVGGEGGLGFVEGGAAEGDDKAARGIGVEAVGEPGAGAAAGEVGEAVFHAGAASGPGVDREAGRFVEDDEAVVSVEFGEKHRGRLTGVAGWRKAGGCRMTGFVG